MPNQTRHFYCEVMRESVSKFLDENMLTHAAALSYYMIFSLPSMLMIVLWTSANFYRDEAVRDALFFEFATLVGEGGAQEVMATLENLTVQDPSWWATLVGLALLLFFATTVFDAMRTALNLLVLKKSTDSITENIWKLVRIRVIAISLLTAISFLLVVFLMLDALITAIDNYMARWLGEMTVYVLAIDSYILTTGITTVLFALCFRYLPDIRLRWRDTWFGALLTALMFDAGKYLISILIGNSDTANLYDAAGSILVLMLWVYYAAAIFLFGAAFTFTRAELIGKR